MRISRVSVPALWVLLAGAAVTAAPVEECAARLGSVAGSGPERFDLRSSGDARLVYLGVRHGRDPSARELHDLEAAFRRLKPTVALYEGHTDGVETDRDATVRRHGESGLVRFLAHRAGIPARPLEPAPRTEVARLLEIAEPIEVELFYVLRETLRLRHQEGLAHERLEAAVAELLADRGLPGLPGALATPADVEREFWERWRYPLRWQEPPAEWFDPTRNSTETGGLFTNELARTVSGLRDDHMFRVVAAELAAGRRVFAVAGANHVRAQASALRCLLR